MMDRDDDLEKLAALAPHLTAPDLDDETAARIARQARASVGHGPSPLRFVEPLFVASTLAAFFAWTLYQIYQVFH